MEPPSRRRLAIFNSLPILITTVVVMGVIALIALGTIRSVRRNAQTPVTACLGESNARLAAYAPSAGIHPTVAYRQLEDTSWVPDNAVIERSWLPAGDTETELVVCLTPAEPLTLPLCAAPDGDPVLYGYAQPLRIVNAASADVLATGLIPSVPAPAAGCIADPDALPPPRPVTNLQIQAWITPYAFIP